MKRRWRITSRIAVGLSLVFGALLLGALAPVDRRSLDESNLLPALHEAHSPGSIDGAAPSTLRAGFGRARLTPIVGTSVDNPDNGEFRALPLAGFGARQGRPAEGTNDNLWVKAIAFAAAGRTGVVVTADALIIPREVADITMSRLAQARRLERAQIFFSATHTHCGPGGWGEGPVGEAFAGPFRAGIRDWMAQQLAVAVETALDDLSPAALGTGSFAAPDFIRNRLSGGSGVVDPEFALLAVRQMDGDMAVLGSYGAHATVLGASFMQFSGDYPGAWQRGVEEATGGLALFAAGAVGSQAPRAPAGGISGATLMGGALAAETQKAMAGIHLTNVVRFQVAGLTVRLPPLQVRLTEGLRLRPWLARRFLPVGDSVHLQGFRFNDSIWLSTPCDFSGELALELKDEFRSRSLAVHVTSFNGDYVGYVLPSRYFNLKGYETRTMSFYGPHLSDHFMTGLRRIVAALERP